MIQSTKVIGAVIATTSLMGLAIGISIGIGLVFGVVLIIIASLN